MRNVKLTLRYDGTAYRGWQIQKNLPTVAQTVADAVYRVTGERVNLIGCGRTDAGVHAEVYAANFRTGSRIPAERFPFALNANLPEDIAVLGAEDVAEDFHATFNVTRKEYTYRFYNAPHRDPLLARRAHHFPRPAEPELWNRAAAAMVGTRDFAALKNAGSTELKSTVRTIFHCRVEEESPGRFAVKVCADGFLYRMVRNVAGTILYAGLGKISDTDAVLNALDRSGAGPALPPHGLYMTGVWYG